MLAAYGHRACSLWYLARALCVSPEVRASEQELLLLRLETRIIIENQGTTYC